jgi:hypothetical protein
MRKMEETGVDFFADVHGDEELTYNFIAVHACCAQTLLCKQADGLVQCSCTACAVSSTRPQV